MSKVRPFVIAGGLAIGVAFAISVHVRLSSIETLLQNDSVRVPPGGPGPSRPRPTIDAITFKDAVTKGDRRAKVALVEYSDYQCSFCKGYAETTMPRLVDEYVRTGKVVLVMKQFPLTAKHSLAVGAAEAALCAHRQGLYWPMHDRMIAGAPSLETKNLLEWGASVGLQRNLFEACLQARDTIGQIDADMKEARALGMTGTPAFVVGLVEADTIRVVRRIFGSQPYETFAGVINGALNGG